jgi:RecQ family ATP-dependent DNA helicase
MSVPNPSKSMPTLPISLDLSPKSNLRVHTLYFSIDYNHEKKVTIGTIKTQLISLDNPRKMVPPSGIIYCASRQQCEALAQGLRQKFQINADFYHAGLAPPDRSRVQGEWGSGAIQVVVATVAFGMGIDKSDVRFVIHQALPQTLEGYYQETGRAGRDGQPSTCVLYYRYSDVPTLLHLIAHGEGSDAQKDRQRSQLRQMVAYCENTIDCRRTQILSYFGETFSPSNCRRSCDNCRAARAHVVRDLTRDIQQIISLVSSVQRDRVTLAHCMDVFRGSRHSKIKSLQHESLPAHGKGSHVSKTDTERLFRQLVCDDILEEYLVPSASGFSIAYCRVIFLFLEYLFMCID